MTSYTETKHERRQSSRNAGENARRRMSSRLCPARDDLINNQHGMSNKCLLAAPVASRTRNIYYRNIKEAEQRSHIYQRRGATRGNDVEMTMPEAAIFKTRHL